MLQRPERIHESSDDVRRIKLAARLAVLGISECDSQYRFKIERNTTLNEAISSQLSKAIEICNEISYKVMIPEIEVKAGKDLDYLFNWNRIHDSYDDQIRGEETWNFCRFCYGVLAGDSENIIYPIDRVREITRNEDLDRIDFTFSSNITYDLKGDIVLDRKNNLAYFRLYENGEMVVIRKLVIKQEYRDVYVFERKKIH
jgi:hypothetical protein